MGVSNDDYIMQILRSLQSLDYIKPEEIPNIDLYMDQVTTFIESELAPSNHRKDGKILTKTMINNYAKNDLLPPPAKKKYSKEHVLLLVFIYYYKGILSITSTGKGKMTKVEDYNETSRAIKGSLVQKLDDEEELAMIYAIPEEQEKVFVTANNKAVILLSKEIPVQGKLTSGVRIIDIRGINAKVEIM